MQDALRYYSSSDDDDDPRRFVNDASDNDEGEALVEMMERGVAEYKKQETSPATKTKKKTTVFSAPRVAGLQKRKPVQEEPQPQPKPQSRRLKPGEKTRCVLLYEQGIKTARRLEQQRKDHESATVAEEKEECSFAPRINPKSKEVMMDQHYRAPAERFSAEEQRAARARLSTKGGAMEKELEGCTFAPEIEPCSSRIVERTRSVDGRFCRDSGERLYADSRERVYRQVLRDNYYLDEQEATTVGARKISKADATATVERLAEWRDNRDKMVDSIRSEMVQVKVGTRRHVDPDHVVDRLFNQPRENSSIMMSEYDMGYDEQKPRVSNVSALLASTARTARFEALFHRFDCQRVGSLSMESLRKQVSSLEPQYAGILGVFAKLPDEAEVTLEEFVDQLTDFERRYGPQPWGRGGSKPTTTQRSHTPVLTERSETLVSTRANRVGTVHEDLYKKGVRKMVAAKKTAQEREERPPLDPQCTFKPQLSRRSEELSVQNLLRSSQKYNSGRETPNSRTPSKSDELLQRIEEETRGSENSMVVNSPTGRLDFSSEAPNDLLSVIHGVLRQGNGNAMRMDKARNAKRYASANVAAQLGANKQRTLTK